MVANFPTPGPHEYWGSLWIPYSPSHSTSPTHARRSASRTTSSRSWPGSDWGCTKEVLLSTYKAIGHSVINYALPIWTPSLSDSLWGDLQVKQNAALRTVAECHVMTSVPYLHHDTRLMTVREHNELLSIQLLLGAFKEGHPDHRTTEQQPPGSRQVRPTLLAKFGNRLLEYVDQETLKDLDEPTYGAGHAQILQDLAAKATSSYTPPIWKIVWDEPKINKE